MKINNSKYKRIGKEVIFLTSVASTNDYLKSFVAKNQPISGLTVIAGSQPSGRGQGNNKWHSSADKNVIMSVFVAPKAQPIETIYTFNMAIANAVRKTIATWLPDKSVKVKWPNDIYVGDKKVAGLLIENSLSLNGFVNSIIIGIGININEQSFPSELTHATSVCIETNEELKVEKAIEEVISSLDEMTIEYFEEGKDDASVVEYMQHLYRINEEHNYIIENIQVKGTIKGVSAEGQLLIEIGDKLRKFGVKEISFVI